MRRQRFARKIILMYSVFIGIVVAFLLFYSVNLVYSMHLSVIKREMVEKLGVVELLLKEENSLRPGQNIRIDDVMRKSAHIINLRLTIIDFKGKVIADTEVDNPSLMDNHLYRPEIKDASAEKIGYSIRRSATLRFDTLYSAKKSEAYYIRLAKPLNEIETSVSAIRKGVFTAGILLAIGSLIMIGFYSLRLSKPIRETGEFALQFARGELHSRIKNYTDDEIGYVQRSLNMMADTIEDKIKMISEEREKLRITLETIPEGIALLSFDKKIVFTNTTFNKIFGINHTPMGRLYFEAIRNRAINAYIDAILSTERQVQFDEDMADGRIFSVIMSVVHESETVRSIVIVMHDVTESKKIERIKADLVGNMSHELKTPITIMKGYLETVKESIMNPDVCRPMIDKAIENADRQTSLINDILKLHRMERSNDFPREDVNVGELVHNCINIIKPKSAEKDILFSVEMSALSSAVKGNRFLAEEIFFNLIDNAVNYNNPRGHVAITAEKKNSHLAVHIEDTGIGIPKESISRIFERFYRVDKSRSRATGGTGLGLSIVKHAAELMGWDISVDALDHGTRFTVIIPVQSV
jgi:two-component system, OmpR family, phosphate regulon sensor histidine kinase PhoR